MTCTLCITTCRHLRHNVIEKVPHTGNELHSFEDYTSIEGSFIETILDLVLSHSCSLPKIQSLIAGVHLWCHVLSWSCLSSASAMFHQWSKRFSFTSQELHQLLYGQDLTDFLHLRKEYIYTRGRKVTEIWIWTVKNC